MKSKIKKIIILLCLLLLIIIIFLTSFMLKKKNNRKQEENYVEKEIQLNFENRIDKLNSFDSGDYYKFGWLQIQGTNIDVPILDSESSSNTDVIDYSYGWMSTSYVTGENRLVMMGHNIVNVSNKPMLPSENLQNFEALMAFSYYGFAKDNLYIKYTEDNKEEIYLIYAVGFYDYGYDNAESFNNKEDIDKYIKKVKKNSIYDYDIDVNSDDDIITIKTCTRYFGADEKQQFVIDARKLRNNEKTIKYQVKTNKNYKKLNIKEEKL